MRKIYATILFLWLGNFLLAQWYIKPQELRKESINLKAFYPTLLSHKGDTFIGYDVLGLKHKLKGFVYGLRVFKFKANGTYQLMTIKLPITFMVGVAFANKEKNLIVVGNYGTKILNVNLENGTVKTIFKYQEKKPGFRTEALVVGHKNKVYLSGYFYDKDQYTEGDYVVQMHYDGRTVKFTKEIDLENLYIKLDGLPQTFHLLSGNLAYLSRRKGRTTYLYFYNKRKLIEIAKAFLIEKFAGAENRIFYSMRKTFKQRSTYVKDIQTGKVWAIGQKNTSYTYPFISTNANVILTTVVNTAKQKINVYYGKAKENYKLNLLLQNAAFGPLKLSGDGKVFLHISKHGAKIDFIPK